MDSKAEATQPIQMTLAPQPGSEHLTGWACGACGETSHRGYVDESMAREYGATHAQVCANDWTPDIEWTITGDVSSRSERNEP